MDPISSGYIAPLKDAADLRDRLSRQKFYSAPSGCDVTYSRRERAMAARIASSTISAISSVAIKAQDDRFDPDSLSTVIRYLFEDGTAGYFKPFSQNAWYEYDFDEYYTSSLRAATNEVLAHQLAKAMGGEYASMVPETAFRIIGEDIGSIQREVKTVERMSSNYWGKMELRGDYHRAAVFDFVVGNLDRHSGNFLYGREANSRRLRVRLIDNSFIFPARAKDAYWGMGSCVFADNLSIDGSYSRRELLSGEELLLTAEDRTALERAGRTISGWMDQEFIGKLNGKFALKRISYLLEKGSLAKFSKFLDSSL